MTTAALPGQQTASIVGGADAEMTAPSDGAGQSGVLQLTPAQRGYVDALTAAGIHPSSELRALSIGSYVCQARAAGRNGHAVWDYVAPMVRSDVADARVAAPQSASSLGADVAIADYIRIATERLC